MKTIIALLLLVISPDPVEIRARHTVTLASLKSLHPAVETCAEATGRLPSQEEGLEALISKPPDWPQDTPWTPLLDTLEVLCDGWGTACVYVTDPNVDGGFGIYSCGQDRKLASDGNDRNDINTWSDGRDRSCYYPAQIRRAVAVSRTVSLSLNLLTTAGVAIVLWTAVTRAGHRRQP